MKLLFLTTKMERATQIITSRVFSATKSCTKVRAYADLDFTLNPLSLVPRHLNLQSGTTYMTVHFSELSATEITIIANDIAAGMEYLHKLQPVPVIHRDLNRYRLLLS